MRGFSHLTQMCWNGGRNLKAAEQLSRTGTALVYWAFSFIEHSVTFEKEPKVGSLSVSSLTQQWFSFLFVANPAWESLAATSWLIRQVVTQEQLASEDSFISLPVQRYGPWVINTSEATLFFSRKNPIFWKRQRSALESLENKYIQQFILLGLNTKTFLEGFK